MNVTRKNTQMIGLAALGLAAAFPQAARAQAVTNQTINATDSIYAAQGEPLPGGATAPTDDALAGGTGRTLTFSSVTGTISFNGGGNYNDPDGLGSASDSSTNADNGYAGIAHNHVAGFLVGLFTAGPNTGPVPASLTFSNPGDTLGIQTDFPTLAPGLDQPFFIGDGLTGDGTGAVQQFIVPDGATALTLGFADAGGYHGDPGSYGDNLGHLTASFTVTPEPSQTAALALGALGLAALALKARKRRSVS